MMLLDPTKSWGGGGGGEEQRMMRRERVFGAGLITCRDTPTHSLPPIAHPPPPPETPTCASPMIVCCRLVSPWWYAECSDT